MAITSTIGFRLPQGGKSPVVRKTRYSRQGLVSVVAWITLLGICFPPIDISPGFVHATLGRFVAILLLVPALIVLKKSGRSGVASDFFAVSLFTWMLISSALNGGFKLTVVAEALEFLGAYLIGRAFFFGPSNLQAFVQALKGITVAVIALGLLDTLSWRNVTLDSFGIPPPLSQLATNYRFGLMRATSVFENAEHYGTFCAAVAPIFLYSERGIRRILYVGLCFFGCAFALSSGPLMVLVITTALFSYDRILKHDSWRWKIVMSIVGALMLAISLVHEHPIEWIISHLTLDAQSGWFRLGTWNYALPLVELSPFFGYGLTQLAESGQAAVYLWSIDCLWLIEALRYGLPAVILLMLTMFLPMLRRSKIFMFGSGVYMMSTGFSLAIVAMGLIGLTVHFWNGPWLFLSLCIGIRASLEEYEAAQGRQLAPGVKAVLGLSLTDDVVRAILYIMFWPALVVVMLVVGWLWGP